MIADLSGMPSVPAFDGWDRHAWVRRSRDGTEPKGTGTEFFPAELVPHLGHPAVLASPDEQRRYLAAQHLFQWLRFTVHFEISVVNRATHKIADGTSGLLVPAGARTTAYQIYVDEGFHSLESLRVLEQVEWSEQIAALPYDFGPFLGQLDAIGQDRPERLGLVRLLQVCVFETLVTSILSDIPNDERVLPVVRELVGDHAADERRHHAYFSTLFRSLWAQLSPTERRLAAELLPDLIVRSLQPATAPAYDALLAVGFAPSAARDVVRDSYGREAVAAGIRHAARRTIRLFEACGALDPPGVRERYLDAGLLVG
jgi:P-aminobenzoate N-oxygenase AurF